MGLKTYSVGFRNDILKLNLQTPTDLVLELSDLVGADILASYLSEIGQDAVIGNSSVKNPGSVVTAAVQPRKQDLNRNYPVPSNNGVGDPTIINDYAVNTGDTIDATANVVLPKLFNKNRPFDNADPSENDPLYESEFGYTYTSLLNSIGKLTVIHDLNIPDALLTSSQASQTPAMSLGLLLQDNRYAPTQTETYDATITNNLTLNQNFQPYVDATSIGEYNVLEPKRYLPASFLNLSVGGSNAAMMLNINTDPLDILLNGSAGAPLANETLMMNVAALELKFAFNQRVMQINNQASSDLNQLLDNAIADPSLLNDPNNWSYKDYTISTSDTSISPSDEFLNSLNGGLPFANMNYNSIDYTPQCFGNTTPYDNGSSTVLGGLINDLIGRTASNDRDVYFLNNTGDGQKYSLFSNINMNKYSPNFLADYESGLFSAGQQVAQVIRGISGFLGIGAGARPVGDYYIGSKTKSQDPFYLLQDADGDIVNTTESMTQVLKSGSADKPFDEPGYDEVSQYGSIGTNFMWVRPAYGTANTGSTLQFTNMSYQGYNRLSVSKNFIECAILDKTQRLLNKGLNGGKYPSPIDQSLTKFYDGYMLNSRGSGVITPVVTDILNKEGEIVKHKYSVPGLDGAGQRNNDLMYANAELCRVWTKDHPYATINSAMRYSELIRSEQNSILDRFGNLSIFPSSLNVNTGYGNVTTSTANAKKYMLSIENLAWRDVTKTLSDSLPNCEKGPNGGRVMWFPPYDIEFTEDTNANWTTHQFLGRPEPIYTYNNTERSGFIKFKIVVDHPSILNLLVQKELANLNDGQVDEILAAFWAGCVQFDIFDLARIYNQFSQSDLDYFKKVIGGLDLRAPNASLTKKISDANPVKQAQVPTADSTNTKLVDSKIKGYGLYFENDVPLDPKAFSANKAAPYDTGKIESFSTYYQQYKSIVTTDTAIPNAQSAKGANSINPTWMQYNQVIGGISIGSSPTTNYFTDTSNAENWYGFDRQKNAIASDLSSSTFYGFDMDIDVHAFASPLGPAKNTGVYNSSIAQRRYQSVMKWLLTEVMNQNNKSIYRDDKTTELTTANIDDFISGLGTTSKTTIYRGDSTDLADLDMITFNLIQASSVSTTDAITGVTGYSTISNAGVSYNYFTIVAPSEGDDTTPQTFCCFETTDIATTIQNNLSIINTIVTEITDESQVGSIDRITSDAKYADVVCGALSVEASYSRRVDLTVTPKQKKPKPTTPVTVKQPSVITVANDSPTNSTNVTKRDIAQRILGSLITECDYFSVIQDQAPTVYSSIKQKLKYFSPAFHAMTPEGLNTRLTFLQQCLRPGDTITSTENNGCDAGNTAFGRPPVCVLRVGDLYNTKIIINSLNITYDPLVWDLNPEGIGVQPMIANVQMSFKYIGGSGLRTYVDQLQNALSFNYYANADIYDPRTYANTNLDERNLINQETNYFDGNQLDLIPIVASAQMYGQDDFNTSIPLGTIGNITLERTPTAPGGIFNDQINTSTPYDPTVVYQAFKVVSNNGQFYLRLIDDKKTYNLSGNTKNGVSGATPTSTTYWTGVTWQNYGEQAFTLEFNGINPNITGNTSQYLAANYYNSYEVEYKDYFDLMYQTYGSLIGNNFKYNKLLSDSSILLQLLLNKNYNKILKADIVTSTDSSGTVTSAQELTIYDQISALPMQYTGFTKTVTGITSGSTDIDRFYLYKAFDVEANNRNYVEFGDYQFNDKTIQFSPMKLHLYPQDYLYKIGDGNSIVSQGVYNDGTRFDPGNLTGGYYQASQEDTEVGGMYLKDYSQYRLNLDGIFDSLRQEMEARLSLNLSHFWFYTGNSINTYKDYLTYFDESHKNVLTGKFKQIFETYYSTTATSFDSTLDQLTSDSDKFALMLGGLSVVADGYDLRRKTDGTALVFEVIPNGKELTDTAEDLFGYEPYNEYKTLSFNNFQVVNFTGVSDNAFKITAAPSTQDKLEFLSFGNGNYFFKQISKNPYIQQISKSGYTYNNLLVESIPLNDETAVTAPDANFMFATRSGVNTGVTINSLKDENAQSGFTRIDTISNSDYDGTFYGMKYTFEKINYELFDFSNKTLDIMLNDNFITPEFDLDIVINNNNEFTYQLGNASANAGARLFYYGNNTGLSNTKIRYYNYNIASVSGTTTQTILNNINQFISYTMLITDELLNAGTVSSSPEPDVDAMVGTNLNMSGLLDLMFLDFYNSIAQTDFDDVLTQIKTITPLGMDSTTKSGRTQITNRYSKIGNILDDIFTNIGKYKTDAAATLTDINTNYNNNYNDVKVNVNNVIAGNTNSSSIVDITPALVSQNFMKGDASAYTLVIRDAKGIKDSVKNNYKLFTTYMNEFNIVTTSTAPQVKQ